MTVGEGRDRQSGDRRSLVAPNSVLLPASQVLQDSVNLFFFAESLKERQQVEQLCVIHIVKPGLDWHLKRRGKGNKGRFGPSLTTKSLIHVPVTRQHLRDSQHFLGGKCKKQASCRQ